MKSNVLIILSIFSIVLGIIVFNACQNEESLIGESDLQLKSIAEDAIYVENGILHLSSNTASKVASRLSDMTEEEFRQWEDQLNFVSLRTEANSVHDELAQAGSKEEYYAIVEKNNDILAIEDNSLVLKIDCGFYNSIC